MRKMLIIKACGVDGEEAECEIIRQQAEMYGISTRIMIPKSEKELREGLVSSDTYDFIYLSSHGNDEGLCNNDNSLDLPWGDFGSILCDSMCMEDECILMLSCCRGGLNQVAFTLFYCCPKIAYVVGPRQSLSPDDMLISYSILLYNLIHRHFDPVVGCRKIDAATDIRFVCFDRLEVEGEASYMLMVKAMEDEFEQDVKSSTMLHVPVVQEVKTA